MDETHNDGSIRFVRIRHRGISFQIALAAEANDPVSGAYRTGRLEPIAPLVELARRLLQPGARVLDLGAHVGGFALTAAALGCRVIAVEAAPRQVEVLRAAVLGNGFTQLHVVHAAVGDQGGMVDFSCHGPWGHVACAATRMPARRVPAVRVEDLLAEAGWSGVDFVKMDVEGSEVRALHGMANLLRRGDAPPLYFESNRHTLAFYGESPESLKALLRGLGYRLYRVRWRGLMLEREESEQDEVVADFLAVKHLPAPLRAWRRGRWRGWLRRIVDRARRCK